MPVAGFGETPFRVVGLPGELRHPIGQDGQPLRGTDAGQPVPAAPDLVVRLVGAVEAGAGLRHVRTGGVDCGCADVQLLLVPRQFPVGAVRSREHPLAARGEVRPFQVEVTGVLDGGALRGGPAGRVGVCEGTAGFGLGLARLLDGALRVVGGALELFDAVGALMEASRSAWPPSACARAAASAARACASSTPGTSASTLVASSSSAETRARASASASGVASA